MDEEGGTTGVIFFQENQKTKNGKILDTSKIYLNGYSTYNQLMEKLCNQDPSGQERVKHTSVSNEEKGKLQTLDTRINPEIKANIVSIPILEKYFYLVAYENKGAWVV